MVEISYHFYVVVFAIGFIVLQYIQDKIFPCSNEESKTSNPQLLIAILSSRPNFNKREAIRRSWGQMTKNHKQIFLKFFIGKECSIPSEDRFDELACTEANNINYDLHSSAKKKFWGDITCNTTPENHASSLLNTSSCLLGFGFSILHPLTLTSVGLHVGLLEDIQDLEVVFKDPEEVFERILFNKKTCSFIEENFCFVDFKHPFFLPRYFEGEISLSTTRNLKIPSKHCHWVSDDCLRFTYGKTKGGYEKYKRRCSYVIANFFLPDKAALERHLAEKGERRSKWLNEQTKIGFELKYEAEKYGDIIYFPNVIDVYRNLPLKLLEVFKWTQKNYRAVSVLKVDDDTFVNVPLLARSIAGRNLKEEDPSIWSHFYYHRAVPLFGKWADPEFRGLTYPPFPSGSGYLLSGSLVSFLSENAHFLKLFQGEDISIGLWTEILQIHHKEIHKHDVSCWLPSPTCNESFLIPELTSQEMMKNTQ